MKELNHKFLVNIVSAFQDKEYLYLASELMINGDLRTMIQRQKKYTEMQAKFIVGCILIGLENLHMKAIVHKDIKPENLLIDDKGYIHISDLGIARQWKPDNINDNAGTPEYMEN